VCSVISVKIKKLPGDNKNRLYLRSCVALFYCTDLGNRYGPGVIPLQGTWGGRMINLNLNYVAGYTGVLLFLFERTHNYYEGRGRSECFGFGLFVCWLPSWRVRFRHPWAVHEPRQFPGTQPREMSPWTRRH